MDKIYQKLENYKKNNLFRDVVEVNENQINFSSNDYLGLSKSEEVKQAFIQAVEAYGFGSGSSPLISGYHSIARRLEKEFTNLLSTEDAIFFNSGYHANLGMIQALDMPIIMDKLCHASIIDGARLSGNKFYRYPHNNLEILEKLLQRTPRSLLISERVFSMEGDVSDIEKIQALARKYEIILAIDDAHGFGILDNNIRSDIIIIPLGKALGGIGAIIAGNKDIVTYLRQFSRSYAYSTALPPAVIYANLIALKVMREETWRLSKLKSLIEMFNLKAKEAGIKLASQHLTPIRSVLVGDIKEAKILEKKLQAKGFFVKAIVPPTVQISRIRISLSSNHKEQDIIKLIELLT